jgi:hypothetical protein
MRSFDDILFYDEIFDVSLFKQIGHEVSSVPKWQIQCSSVEDESWFWKFILDDNKFITETCFDQVKNIIGDNYSINTVYINGQASLQSGDPHFDSEFEDEYTFLIYVNETWNATWGGHTVFLNKYWNKSERRYDNFWGTNKMNTVSVLPSPNSGLFFPSNIVHFAEGPSKKMSQLRLTLVYKLKKH